MSLLTLQVVSLCLLPFGNVSNASNAFDVSSRFAGSFSFHLERRGGVDSDVGAGGADKDRKSLFSLTLSHTDPQDRRDGNVSSFADMFFYTF